MSKPGISARLFLFSAAILVAIGTPSPAQGPRSAPATSTGPDAPSPEDERERKAMERFLSSMEKNPRRGTALDRVYGYHVERGTLDAFVKRFEDRVARDANDGTGWMILGLVESQRGQDAAAIKALRRAEAVRADDPLPSFYLGQSLVLIGRPEEAAEAYERALRRKPNRNDLLDIFQSLGRVYQRGQKLEEALAVWGRLEQLFPGDQQVQEQVAQALAEEGQAEPALARYEQLARSVRDPFRRAQLAMTAADLKVRLGRAEPALHDFESLLGKLRPDSWLYREVRRKIEDVFLRNDDQAGLATYYERWVKKNPDDVEALVRLGRSLAAQGRIADARGWYEQAVKLAPSRRDLRLALIGQLAQDQKFADAAAQYEALDKAEPNNPDTLRDWGALVLRDTTRPEAARKAAAAAIWRKLMEARPQDPVTVAQVADLLRQADMADDALALYRRAIELAPNNAQYREYLGEYLHALKRPDEALAAWGQIADGANRDASNLARLAEVLSGFGYIKQAIPPLTQALELDRDNFDLVMKLGELLHRAERYDEARARLDAADKLAERDEEKGAVLEARIKNDQAAGQLTARADAMRKELEAAGKPTAADWSRLARYLEADSKLPEAGRAIARAIEADPRSVQAWTLAARIRESAGNLADAVDAYRRLAEVDRRNRTEYLTQVAKLEARLGRTDAALKAGRDLIAAAPGNPEHYEFFAQLCFQLGKPDDGLDTLRRAVRVNSNDTKILLTLAETLAGEFRIDEAIEMYWRSYEKAAGLDEKLNTVSRLTELYLQRNQLDRLLSRLQRQQTESPQNQREASICLAQAYASSGDLGMARAELERLLSANARDTQLLQQLSKLAEEEGDIEGAAKHQKQLIELAPSDEGQLRLAQLYVRHGDVEEAQGIWTRMAMAQKDPHHMLQAIDRLLGSEKPAAVLEVAESMIRKDPHDWEALYREGLALSELGKKDDAAQRFRRLLDLRRNDDDKSAASRVRSRDPRLQSAGARQSSFSRRQPLPLETRVGMALQVRRATKLDSRFIYSTSAMNTIWTPSDFGQARMSSLAWLVSLARGQDKAKEDAVLAQLRAAKDRVPRDPRAAWDWYYLNLALGDNSATYEAARDLSRAAPADPMALWIYLSSLGSRQFGQGLRDSVARGTEGDDGTPPLPPDEIDHVLSAYRTLRQRRPELAARQIVSSVAVELKRAKRADLGDTLYREAVDGARQLDEVASVLSLAGERGDVEGMIALSDRYDRLQAGKSSSAMAIYYYEGPAYSMSQAMSVRARARSYDDVLRLLDHYLAATRRKHEQAGKARGRSSNYGNPYSAGNTPSYQVWSGRTPKNVSVNFPMPNEYYDYGSIAVLRTAYELYKGDDLTSDLIAHVRKQAEAAPTPADALYPRLALSYLDWWEDDKDAAVAEFTKVADSASAESDLRLELADLQEKRGEPTEALALVDTFSPQDNAGMRRREEQALRLAVTTGNLERARQAAERLFGLRLDTDTQIRLAGQMHQLGQHELAEAVLGRARRRAGNKASALVGLMLQYQRQDKIDAAVQAALQILQSTTAMHTSNPNVYNPNNTDAARSSAIQVLARSGRIKGIIERAEEQLKRTPNAIQLHQALADYYKAAGLRDKARAELIKVAELRPDDATLRLQVGTQLMQEGQSAAALEHFKAALKKDPSVTMRSYYQIENAFRQANKTGELLDLLEQMDIRKLGRSNYIMNTMQNLMNDESTRGRVMKLFRKAWDAFPQERYNMIAYVYRNELWEMPEMYDYALQSLIPDASSFSLYQQWNAFGRIISYSGDGKINTMVSRLLDLAAAQNKLPDLSRQIEAAVKKFPAWKAGRALEALIDCRTARYDAAAGWIDGLLKEDRDDRMNSTVFWIIGTELENYASMKPLAMRVYERGMEGTSADPFTLMNFEYSPAKRLVDLYVRDGRRDDWRRVLLEMTRPHDFPNYDDDYINQMKMSGLASAARELAVLGFAADAVPLYNQALAAAESIPENGPMYVGNRDGIVQQARKGLETALQGLKDEQLVQTVRGLLEPRAEVKGKKPEDRSKPATAAKPRKRDQAVDLVLLIHPRDLDKAAIRSLFADSVAAGARDPKLLSSIEEPLRSLRERNPDDLSVRIAVALTAMAEGDSKRIRDALDALAKLVERTPLEVLSEGAHANTRQRTEAARQVPLWLVARVCGKQEPWREYGDRFAARAVEAARRQSDNRWMLAMLRERGQSALDRGNTREVEGDWGRMLELILARKPAKQGATGGPQPVAAVAGMVRSSAAVATATTAPRTKAAPRPEAGAARVAGRRVMPRPGAGNVPILTLDRFEQAMQVARLAADKGLTALSVRALREALKGGPPVVVTNTQNNNRRMIVTRSGVVSNEPPDEVTPRVVSQLVGLEGTWQRRRAPAGQVYETLRDVAMPEGRPAEIFVYAQSLENASLSHPRSFGAMLAAWAVKAGKADDLRRKIEARKGQPMAEYPATILSAQLAIAGGEVEPANRALKAVGERLKRDTLRPTTELAAHAALPALDRPETRDAALAVLDACVKSHEGTDTSESTKSMLLLMARRQLKNGDVAGGRKRLEEYLAATERNGVQYGGDYGLYLRKQTLRTIAAEYAHAGHLPDFLKALGDFLDAPTSRDYGSDPSLGDLLVQLAGQLATRPARERYEILKTWTMPTPRRRVVRILSAVASDDAPPAVFRKPGTAATGSPALPRGEVGHGELFSTAAALIAAAREVGALDALADEARAAAGEKVENAQGLHLLIEMARGRGASIKPEIQARVQEVNKDADAQADPSTRGRGGNSAPRPFPWTDYLLARTVLDQDDPALRRLGLELLQALRKHAQRLQDQPTLVRLHNDIAVARARRAGAGSPAIADRTGGLALWHPASIVPAYSLGGGSTPARWAAHQGHVAHVAGPGDDYLLFDYPLTGTFELSLDAYSGGWAEGNLAYGGLAVEPFWNGYGSHISPIGGHEAINRAWRFVRSDDFNRITVRVSPGKVHYVVNGHLFFEDDDPSPTSPWLGLLTHRERHTAWRNLAIRGEPTIPRVVRLSHGDRLEGWVTGFYNESQPPRRTVEGTDRYGNTTQVPKRSARPGASSASSEPTPVDPDAFDWCSIDGVIRGRRTLEPTRPNNRSFGEVEDASPTGQSRLYYHRPLRDGDVLTYEFLYEPDQVMVHPALDRLAFLLEPDRVRLRWMTAGPQDASGLPADNTADEPENRRGPAKLPLKPGEWNAIKLALNGDRIALYLNGAAIYERALEPANSRQFGLFHDKQRTSVQVRNVELRGRWPESLPAAERADLAALRSSAPNAPTDRRARHALIGEPFFSLEADEVLARARELKPEDRYRLLSEWVLSSPDHPGLRLRGDFSPSDPAPPVIAEKPGDKPTRPAARVESGGEVRTPAIELVDAAAALGRPRLDELAERVAKIAGEGDVIRRARLAMQALIAMARGDDDKAAASLEQLKPLLEKRPADQPEEASWPELAVTARAIERPRLRPAALALLDIMVDQAQKKSPRWLWEHQVKNVRARARVLDQLGPGGPPFGTDSDFGPWARVTHGRADTRGTGEPIPQWTLRNGEFTHHPGHANDLMYLRMPLRGDFQLDCELTTFNWREMRICYGGMTIGPMWDLKKLQRWHFNREWPAITLNPPLEPLGDWFKYRLVVKNGSMTAFVNGRQVHQAPLPAECEPWLALHCTVANTTAARNIAISGRPIIPEQVNLSALPDLTGWLSDYYGDSATGDNPDWDKQGEEIIGRLRDEFPGGKQESVLLYNRPMLEDGEISYEFFYEPGKTITHPALDRLAFLLEPDGVKVHRLTDAQYERTGLSPDNAAVDPENRRGPSSLPLKVREWNRLQVNLAGDRVALRLNGQLIYERALEESNQRVFGLFHYAEETEARVRKVVYRGEWPRALPDQLRSHQATGGDEDRPK